MHRVIVVEHLPEARRTLQSVVNLDTRVLTLSPRFLEALKGVAPKRRGRRWPLFAVLALGTLLAIFVAEPSVRDLARNGGRRIVAAVRGTETKPLPTVAAPAAPTAEQPQPIVEAPFIMNPVVSAPAAPVVAPTMAKSGQKKGRSVQRAAAHGGQG
jgi:hypothetical protein